MFVCNYRSGGQAILLLLLLALSLPRPTLFELSFFPPSLVERRERGDCGGREGEREAKCSSLDVRGSLSDVVVVEDCRSSSLHDKNLSEFPSFCSETISERFEPSKVNSTLEMSVT